MSFSISLFFLLPLIVSHFLSLLVFSFSLCSFSRHLFDFLYISFFSLSFPIFHFILFSSSFFPVFLSLSFTLFRSHFPPSLYLFLHLSFSPFSNFSLSHSLICKWISVINYRFLAIIFIFSNGQLETYLYIIKQIDR